MCNYKHLLSLINPRVYMSVYYERAQFAPSSDAPFPFTTDLPGTSSTTLTIGHSGCLV